MYRVNISKEKVQTENILTKDVNTLEEAKELVLDYFENYGFIDPRDGGYMYYQILEQSWNNLHFEINSKTVIEGL